jgi:hypothetical protein
MKQMTEEDKLFEDELRNRALSDYERLDSAINELERQTCDTPRNNLAESSQDCISRAKALEMLGDEPENWTDTEKEIQEVNDYRWFKSILEESPPVTPQQKIGHWIDIMVGDVPAQACDQCNTFYPLAYTGGGHKYCPNCGAKMEVEE